MPLPMFWQGQGGMEPGHLCEPQSVIGWWHPGQVTIRHHLLMILRHFVHSSAIGKDMINIAVTIPRTNEDLESYI